MLVIQLIMPLLAILSIHLFSRDAKENQWVAQGFSLIAMMHTLLLVQLFEDNTSAYQFQIGGKLGMDGISLWLIWLISILMPIVQQSTWRSIKTMPKTFINLLLQIAFWSYAVFQVQDLQLFYISFEGVQIPMYQIIGIYGGRNRKIHAGNQFFLYTLVGSLFFQLTLVIIYQETGTSDYQTQLKCEIQSHHQYLLWLAFFLALAIKIPMIPFHIWLPEAHVEAPTAASVLQAAILLKLGSYGMLRYCLPLFPLASKLFTPFVLTQCVLAIIYSSVACLALWDMKKLIGYSSIGHMNTATLAIFTQDLNGLSVSIYFQISHGIISAGLFLLIGVLYDRYHTRTLKYYRGLVQFMPSFILFFLLFTLANIAVPGTSGFISEFLTFLAVSQINPFVVLLASSAIVLTPAYSLWFFHKISYGTLSPHLINLTSDLSLKEFHMLLPLLILTFFLGFFPSFITSPIILSCLSLLT